MATPCPKVILYVDHNLNNPGIPSVPKVIPARVDIDRPEFNGSVEAERPNIPAYNVNIAVDIPDLNALRKSVSVHSPDSIVLPDYSAPDKPAAPNDPAGPPDVSPTDFNIPIQDISTEFESVLAELNLDMDIPEPISVTIPEPPTIVISEPSSIPLIPLIEASALLSNLIPDELEQILGKPRNTVLKLFTIVDDAAYGISVSLRNKLIWFLDGLLDALDLSDKSRLTGYYDALISLFNVVYQKIVSLRNKANEIDYWIAHFKLQSMVFSQQYKNAVAAFRARLDVFKSEIALIRDYYNAIREAYDLGLSIHNSFVRMARSAISDANRLISKVGGLNNDIASAYRLHVDLLVRLMRRDVLEAELYRLQAEKLIQLYRLLELDSLNELADAQREALVARYNALVTRFNALRAESSALSSIAEANQKRLDAIRARLSGEVNELEGLAKRLSAYQYTSDRMYANQLIRAASLYRDKLNDFLQRLRMYHDIYNRVEAANLAAQADNQLLAASVQAEVDSVHSELQADIQRAYLHEQGIIAGARIMSDARIASTIIESYR